MKKILLLFVLIVGCQQKNLTLTPRPEEWDSMTFEQRNEWSADELRARQEQRARQELFQNSR